MAKKELTPKKAAPTQLHKYAEFIGALLAGEITAKGLDDAALRQGKIEYDDQLVKP